MVDWVRSCYRTDMRFSTGEDDSLVRVKWYFVDPSTPLFPGYNRFASRNWDPSKEPTEWVGEIGEAYITPPERPWRNGQGSPTPGCVQCGCCPSPWWQTGVPWPWPQLYPWSRLCINGRARFFIPRSWIGDAGLRIDGAAQFIHGHNLVGSAPLLIDGAAVFAAGFAWTGSAPLKINGACALWSPYHWLGRAPLKANGSSTFRGFYAWRGQAPLKITGTATIKRGWFQHGSAPLKIGGSAHFPGRVWTGSAPLKVGGTADVQGVGSWTGSAPLEIGGEADIDAGTAWTGSAPLKEGGDSVFAGFHMVTPSGGCGSLPSVLVARFSGGTGTCNCADGTQVTLTYSGTQWNGTLTACGGNSSVVVQCSGGVFKIGSLGSQLVWALTTLSGTTGTDPSLTATITVSLGCSGGTTVTITRT